MSAVAHQGGQRMRDGTLEARARGKAAQSRHLWRLILAGLVASIVAIGGCAGMSETEQRTLTGGAAGAAGGALIGAIAGNAGLGAAIGGATGLAGGFLAGKHNEATTAAYQQGVADGMRQAQQPVSR
jgi:osmotically inducible lipoprotein OsmB